MKYMIAVVVAPVKRSYRDNRK